MKNKIQHRPPSADGNEKLTPAMSETLSLYHGWLGYLLRRLGEDRLEVPAADIRAAVDSLSGHVRVEKDGKNYVITLF